MEKRETLQRSGLNKWVRNNYTGTLQWATGIGKSFAAILAIEHIVSLDKTNKVLIVSPTVAIIDNFKKEFYKFRKKNLLDNCTFICYASLHKEIDTYELVILDEIHHIFSIKRLNAISKLNYSKILGLSASLTELQAQTLATFAPIVDTLTLGDVADEGFISNFTIINYPVELTPTEKALYVKTTNSINYVSDTFFKRAWKSIGIRAKLLYTAENKLNTIRAIVDLFPKEYGIMFSLTKVAADEVADLLGETCVSIHSGHSAKLRRLKLKTLSDGRTRTRLISTAKILDEGVTIPRLSYAVLMARYAKEKQFIQTLGRIIRTDIPDKHALVVRLYVKDTIEEQWVESAQSNFISINVNNYEELKQTIEKIRSDVK